MASHITSKEIKRRTISHDEWEEVKLDFQDLYLNKRWNYKQIAEHLRENYGFYPTQNQFKKRVGFWGFEKNFRKSVIGNSSRGSLIHSDLRFPRGGAVDKAKRRLAHDKSQTSLALISSDSMSLEIAPAPLLPDKPSPKELGQLSCTYPTPLLTTRYPPNSATSMSYQCDINADPVDSFDCTGFVGHIDASERLEGASDVEYLGGDQSMSLFRGSSTRAISILYTNPSPFPSSTNSRISEFPPRLTITFKRAREMEPQYARRYKGLSKMTSGQVVELARGMQLIADAYYRADIESRAEPWYRKVVTAKQRILRHEPLETLRACMGVINSVFFQDRYLDAQDLHRDFNSRLQQLLPANHALLIESKSRWSNMLGKSRMFEEEENELHELLQICLAELGPRHRSTLSALRRLGICLCDRESYVEGEKILRTTLSSIHEWESPELKHWTTDAKFAWDILVELARTLRSQGRYLEAKDALVNGVQRYGHLPMHHRRWFVLHQELAVNMVRMRRMGEGENVMNTILSQESALNPFWLAYAQLSFAHSLYEMDRHEKAARWFKQAFDLRIKISGVHHQETINSCRGLGLCYVKQGLFDDAAYLYEQTIRDLETGPQRNGLAPTAAIQELRGLLKWVEVMRSEEDVTEDEDDFTGSEQDSIESEDDVMEYGGNITEAEDEDDCTRSEEELIESEDNVMENGDNVTEAEDDTTESEDEMM